MLLRASLSPFQRHQSTSLQMLRPGRTLTTMNASLVHTKNMVSCWRLTSQLTTMFKSTSCARPSHLLLYTLKCA